MEMEVDEEPEVPVHVPSKIRFKEDVTLTSNNVNCTFADSSKCEVDVGLLSEGHCYKVQFFMSHFLGNYVDVPPIQTPAVIITDLKKYEGKKGHRVTMEVKCGVHGYMEEEISFENNKNEKITLKVIAKIMGCQAGTPALKSGVKLLQRCTEGMSDTETEWQGFE